MTLEQLMLDIEDFQMVFFPNWKEWPLIFYTNSIAGEVGEMCNLSKKGYGGGCTETMTEEEFKMRLMDEIVDTQIYLDILIRYLEMTPMDLEELVRLKMQVNADRLKDNQGKEMQARNWRILMQKKAQRRAQFGKKKKETGGTITWETIKQRRAREDGQEDTKEREADTPQKEADMTSKKNPVNL